MSNPAIKYKLKINNRSTKTRCEICSKIKIDSRAITLFCPRVNITRVPSKHLSAQSQQ